jgi:hypothetical protein
VTADQQKQGDAPAAWEVARDQVLAELERLHATAPAPLIFWTHPTYAGRNVLVGIVSKGIAGVLAVPREDWDGMRFLALAGVDMTPTHQGPDIEALRREKAAAKAKRKTKETTTT